MKGYSHYSCPYNFRCLSKQRKRNNQGKSRRLAPKKYVRYEISALPISEYMLALLSNMLLDSLAAAFVLGLDSDGRY